MEMEYVVEREGTDFQIYDEGNDNWIVWNLTTGEIVVSFQPTREAALEKLDTMLAFDAVLESHEV